MKKDKFWYREQYKNWVLKNTPYEYAAYVLPRVGIVDDGALDDVISGKGGWGNDAGGVAWPDELVEKYGGEEDQYGYIECEVEALEGINKIPFDEFYRILQAGCEIYLEECPERRPVVEAKIREARKTFDRLQRNHDRWKRKNG